MRPLSPDEIEELRGMLDEYRYERERGIFLSRVVSRGRLAAAGLAALTMLALELLSVYYAAHGHTVVVLRGRP